MTARKPIVQVKPDRIVCDLSSNPLKNDNAFEALKSDPLVQVKDESFSIIGKEQATVYINGRQVNLNGEAFLSYIRALPAERIKNIGIITSPNSTFHGEGDFGIIRIQ